MAENSKSSQYVVDASYVLAFLLPDERATKIERAFERFANGASTFYSSQLLPYEVLNGLAVAVIRKRMKSDQAVDMVKTFLRWDICYEPLRLASVFELALKEHMTVYDASYAWVALDKGVPLLTFDSALMRVMKPA